jgi:Zn-dependent metalloprotease
VVLLAATAMAGFAAGTAAADPAEPHLPATAALTALERHPAAAHLADGQGFTVTDTVRDADGSTHVRLERTYRGLPVVGGDLVVHQGPAGGWQGISQTLRQAPRMAVRPGLDKAAAKQRALAPSQVNREIADQSAKRSTLVVDALGAKPRLAWQVISGGTQEDGTPSRLATYVDARTGAVLHTEQQVQTVEGEGHSLYGGPVALQLAQVSGGYALQDPTRGGTFTTDMGNKSDSMFCQIFGTRCNTGTLFASADTSFGDGTTGNRESAAVDAQYGTAETWDYYQQVHGRTGIAGDGEGSYNRVHYGRNYVNAFWQDACFCMTYGDGDGANYGPLTSLDVAGHEMSHGVTSTTANLTYSGESGGLNEATSDIFGSLVEFHAANVNDPGDYLIGETFARDGQPLRRMDDPASDGASANCWSSAVGNLDVHYSSGVGNHFFYLLAEGSGAKSINGVAHSSPTCDGSTVTGIGRADAGDIWYRALTVYMTSSTDYHDARTATLAAASDLFGAGSAQYAAVDAAWAAVGVA